MTQTCLCCDLKLTICYGKHFETSIHRVGKYYVEHLCKKETVTRLILKYNLSAIENLTCL